MRRASRIPIVLMAAMLPLVAWGRDDSNHRPLWPAAQRSARLGDVSRPTVTVMRPSEQRATVSGRTEISVWRASTGLVTVQRSPRRLAGLARLFGRADRDAGASDPLVVQPESNARLQKKGRLP